MTRRLGIPLLPVASPMVRGLITFFARCLHNMKDGSLLCIGKGNKEWNYSAPHGAGRTLSRREAKRTLNMKEYRELMQGIFTTSVNRDTLDECPLAYKPFEQIIAHIGPTVEIIEQIKPTYNFKAAD